MKTSVGQHVGRHIGRDCRPTEVFITHDPHRIQWIEITVEC